MKPKRTRTTSQRRIRSLRETLAYENNLVVYKFMERYRLSFRQAQDIFLEMKRWLWLSAQASRQPSAPWPMTIIGMREMWMIDEMWHTFVLFTPVYEKFCHRYFGRFLHHIPSTKDEQEGMRKRQKADPEKFEQERLAVLRNELTFVGRTLGPATIRKWFITYGRKYTPENMDRLRLPHDSLGKPARRKPGKKPAAQGRTQKAA